MLASVRAFMNGAIDYAGMFPPARLAISKAFQRYAEHRRSPDGWILGRLVCPAVRVGDLAPLLDALDPEEPEIGLALLGRGGETPEAFRAGTEVDLAAAARLLDAHGERAAVDQLEVRLPDLPAEELAAAVSWLAERLAELLPAAAPCFETSLLEGWQERLPAVMAAVAVASSDSRPVWLKVRCGGGDAASIPEAAALVAAIVACREAGVPLKAAQDLPQPVRCLDPQLGAPVHGFLNLFAAGMLGAAHGLSARRLKTVVEEEDPGAFSFTDQGLRWRDKLLTVEQIVEARRSAVTSFESSSFAEPRDHLRRIGLLEGAP